MKTDLNWDDIPENDGNYERLVPGGYIAQIEDIQDVTDKTGSYLSIEFDIANDPVNGAFAGYYRRQFKRWQNWDGKFRLYYDTPKGGEQYGRIKALKTALERSNGIQIPQFDANMLKWLSMRRQPAGKQKTILLGVLMGYDSKKHKYLNVYQVRDIKTIREGDFEIPDDWKIHYGGDSQSAAYPATGGSGNYGTYDNSNDAPYDDGDMPF